MKTHAFPLLCNHITKLFSVCREQTFLKREDDDVMKQKLENFGSSYIEAIAKKRGRNAEWAKSSVRESASITAEKALELKPEDGPSKFYLAKLEELGIQDLPGEWATHTVLREK